MQKNAIFGWAVFIVIAVVGGIFFSNSRKKAEAQAQADAYTYFSSLMKEDSSTIPNPAGGPAIHPWVLVANPTQIEIEDKVTVKRTSDGSAYTWEITTDPTGGNSPKTYEVKVVFDGQGKANIISGLHGTVTTFPGGWLPDMGGG